MNLHYRFMAGALCLATAVMAWSNPIDATRAQQIAGTVMPGKTLQTVNVTKGNRAPSLNQPAYYVFNAEANQGYVIVAGDDCVPSVLGYSDNGAFDPNDVPEAMQELLNYYAEQVESLSGAGKNSPARLIARTAITPMTTSIW